MEMDIYDLISIISMAFTSFVSIKNKKLTRIFDWAEEDILSHPLLKGESIMAAEPRRAGALATPSNHHRHHSSSAVLNHR